eukprot:SAG31_NODE_15388_length_757_cov_1.623100_1_plen_122_part_01
MPRWMAASSICFVSASLFVGLHSMPRANADESSAPALSVADQRRSTFSVVADELSGEIGPCTTRRDGQCVGRRAGYGYGESCTVIVQGTMKLWCPVFNIQENSITQMWSWLTIGNIGVYGRR